MPATKRSRSRPIPISSWPRISLTSPSSRPASKLRSRSSPGIISKRCFPAGKSTTAHGTYVFDVADRAITLEHRARFTDVYNGDLGVVSRTSIKEGELIVDFDDREVAYAFGKLDEPVLADATTIHKSQGSEYPAVIIPLTTQHYPMLQRNRLSMPNVLISGLLYPMDGRARPELSGVGDLEGDVAIATRQRVLGRLRRLSFKNTAT